MRVAVIIPCLDEALTIGSVVSDFRSVLPEAAIVVVDNGSADDTARVAAAHGAEVLQERRRGKGFAVRWAFRLVEADVYLLVDGDGTYPAAEARRLIQPILDDEADVVIGGRLDPASRGEFRPLNRLGNWLFLATVNAIFGARITDLLTGYRAMSRDFVKRAPVLATGFELETELTILALEREFRTIEVPVTLTSRRAGSHSKIHVFGDGFRILNAIFSLLRDYRPLTFFGSLGLLSIVAGLLPGIFVTWEYTRTHEVRVPSAVLATGLELVGLMLIIAGVILTTLSRRFREIDHQVASLQQEVRRQGTAPPIDLAG